MALKLLRWHDIAVTQGSADAFVQGSVATDIVPEDGVIQQVRQIVVAVSTALSGAQADLEIEWSFTRDTKTAISLYSDDDCLLYDGFTGALVTSGYATFSKSFRYNDVSGIYLVEPTLYMQLDSAGTTVSLSAQARVFYEEVRASEVDILRVLNET